MVKINSDIIRNIVLQNGGLFVPKPITDAIESSMSSSFEDVQNEYENLKEQYSKNENLDEHTKVDYNGVVTLDAYTSGYLPRNSLIPKLLFLFISKHPTFQNLPNEISVLDLGSGTGGIVIGLMDLFRNNPLSQVHVKINACEISQPSLKRQVSLIKKIGVSNMHIYHTIIDFISSDTYEKSFKKLGPYDFIIAANLFAELPREHIDRLLSCIPDILTDNGVFLIAEPPRLYTEKLTVHASRFLRELGLNQFYPCPPGYQCSKEKCFVWIDSEFECPNIIIQGNPFSVPRILKTTWIIFSRPKCSMHDLYSGNPHLTPGVVAPWGRELSFKKPVEYEFCTNSGIRKISQTRNSIFPDKKEVLRRGSILGFNDNDPSKSESWHPINE